MAGGGVLVVLRGNSGSGKTTVARAVQVRFPRGGCAVISQDDVRRKLLREPDSAGTFTIELIGSIARQCLDRGLVVVVEGILNAGRYQRPQREEFTVEQMRPWLYGWQPLDFTAETRFDEAVTAEGAAQSVLAAIGC